MAKQFIWVLVILTTVIPLIPAEPEEKPTGNDATSLLGSPLRSGGNNLFHSLILIPPLETAEILSPRRGYLRTGVDFASGSLKDENKNWLLDYDANLFEGFIDMHYGLANGAEIQVTLTAGVLAEGEGNLVLLEDNFSYLAGERGLGLSDLIIGAKIPLAKSADEENFPYKSALGFWSKLPLAEEENLLSSGGIDLAISYLETTRIDDLTWLHLQIGFTYTGEEEVFKRNIRINNPLLYGAAITHQSSENTALICQVQGNLNAFTEIKTLNQNPLLIQAGFRHLGRDFFIEGGLGWGLNDESADVTLMFSIGQMF